MALSSRSFKIHRMGAKRKKSDKARESTLQWQVGNGRDDRFEKVTDTGTFHKIKLQLSQQIWLINQGKFFCP